MNNDEWKIGDFEIGELMFVRRTKMTYLITGVYVGFNAHSISRDNEGHCRTLWKNHSMHYKEELGYKVYSVKPHINK